MKKLFLALAMTMMVGSMGMAFAANQTLEGDDETNAFGNTIVEYIEEGTYTIIIPDKITLDKSTSTPMEISASEVYIPFDKILRVTVKSANEWNIVDADSVDTNAKNQFSYSLTSGDSVIPNDGTVLEVEAGNTAGITNDFKLQLTQTVTKAGAYEDTLTFTSELADNQDIV